MTTLSDLMRQLLPKGGVWIPERNEHMEIMDETASNVWMTLNAVTKQQFQEFSIPDNWHKVGHAAGAMDQALFGHSPNNIGAPVRQKVINGLRFINVARPASPGRSASGLIEVMVNKAHVLGFEAGRRLSVLRFEDQYYVEVVGDNKHDGALPLANGAAIQQIRLDRPWVVKLPEPTQTLWAFEPALRSFQGPVELPVN